MNTVHEQVRARRSPHRNPWFWLGVGAAAIGITVAIALEMVVRHAEPILKERVIRTLSSRLDSRVELDQLHVSVLSGINVRGGGLRIFPIREANSPDANAPLIVVDHFDFHAKIAGLFLRPMYIGTVHVNGLAITIPPKRANERSQASSKKLGKTDFELGDVECDDSRLVIESSKPDKDPHIFTLKRIVLHGVGRDAAASYDATLTNAVPPGEIHAVGTFRSVGFGGAGRLECFG